MTERAFLRALWVVCFFAVASILGASLYLRWRIDRFAARIEAMGKEVEEESARLRDEHVHHLKAFSSAVPTPSGKTE